VKYNEELIQDVISRPNRPRPQTSRPRSRLLLPRPRPRPQPQDRLFVKVLVRSDCT